MRVRIVVKPSRVRNSNLWHYDVEEFIGGKWFMALIFDGRFRFFGGTTEDKDLAVELARERAREYLNLRKFYDHQTRKEIEQITGYVEEIKVVED